MMHTAWPDVMHRPGMPVDVNYMHRGSLAPRYCSNFGGANQTTIGDDL